MNLEKGIGEYLPRLRRYGRALTGDAVLADELVQKSVERALAKMHLFKPGTNLRAWLFTIMHNVHVNSVRKQGRSAVLVSLDDAGTAAGARPTSPPAQEEALKLRDLGRALEQLPDEQRQAVLLVGLEGLSYRETADVLDVPVGTVMSRLARGREKLRALMDGTETPLRSVK